MSKDIVKSKTQQWIDKEIEKISNFIRTEFPEESEDRQYAVSCLFMLHLRLENLCRPEDKKVKFIGDEV